jgi:hypothetical protein
MKIYFDKKIKINIFSVLITMLKISLRAKYFFYIRNFFDPPKHSMSMETSRDYF